MKRFLPIALLGIASLSFFVGCQGNTSKADGTANADSTVVDNRQFFLDICIDSMDMEECLIESGESLSVILGRQGVSAARIDRIGKESDTIFDIKHFKAGAAYTLLRNSNDSTLQYYIYRNTLTNYIVYNLTDSLHIYSYNKTVSEKPTTAVGRIESSVWNAMAAQGTNPMLAIKLSELYAWQIDFFGIGKGDWFKVLYNTECVDDTVTVGLGRVEAALFNHHGRSFYAIPFNNDSTLSYFDEQGESLRKAFLKAPLNYSRISSRFSNGRYHPVLKIVRPHHGVDYAAPAGTPVVSVGDGVVVRRGYQARGGGNYLVIKHNSLYTTTYMHLQKFAPNMNVGRNVMQGELIAYVGSTGLSTGPHLDFRVHRGGEPIDPLTMESPSVAPISEENLDSFEVVKQRYIKQLDALALPALEKEEE